MWVVLDGSGRKLNLVRVFIRALFSMRSSFVLWLFNSSFACFLSDSILAFSRARLKRWVRKRLVQHWGLLVGVGWWGSLFFGVGRLALIDRSSIEVSLLWWTSV